MHDIKTISEKYQTFYNEQRTIINFHKFLRIYKSITEALAYQRTDDEASKRMIEELRARCARPLAYLEDKLGRVKTGVRDDDRLKQKARELAEAERYDYRHRVDELEAAGFRTSRNR